MSKLVVLFPGANYSTDCPLLYYCDFICAKKGYERISIKYKDILKEREASLEKRISNLREYELTQLEAIKFDRYSDILFISKSIGTVEAIWIADKLKIQVKHIFITPIKETLSHTFTINCSVIAGTEDSLLSHNILREFCKVNKINNLFIDGGDHSLEIPNDPIKSIDILKKIVEYISNELDV